MVFRNSVVGGTTLVRAAIRSPNFVTGVSGWSIDRNGSAEFNNVTIRGGTVISGTSLYYNGAPAAGNLVASITATSGTDSFGNAYLAGITTYSTTGNGLFTQMQTDGDLALGYSSVFANPAIIGAMATGMEIVSPFTNSAPNNDPVHLTMLPGGTTGADRGYAQFSTNTGLDMELVNYGTHLIFTQENASVGLIVDAVSTATADLMSLRTNTVHMFDVDPSGNVMVGGDLQLVNGTTVYRDKLSTTTTVANTSTETVIGSMTLPANDMKVGAIYRIQLDTDISFLASATMTWRVRYGGVAGTLLATMGPTTADGTGQTNKESVLVADVICTAIGASGSVKTSMYETRNWTQAGQVGDVQLSNDIGTTINTTTSNALVVTADWGAASASNTLTAYAICERIA